MAALALLDYQAPTGVNPQSVIGAQASALVNRTITYTYDSLNRLTAAREAWHGKRSGWDVTYHALILSADVLTLGVLYNKIVSVPSEGVVYKRVDLLTCEEYVGQSKSWSRYLERQLEHAKAFPNSEFSFEVLRRAKPGTTLSVLEETWIRKLGGPQKYGGLLQNKRWQMIQSRYLEFGGTEPLPSLP